MKGASLAWAGAKWAAVLGGGSSAGVLYLSEGDPAAAVALLQSGPRTGRAVWWAAQTARQYRRCFVAHAEDYSSTAYERDLAAVHERCAEHLRQVCERNGGVYIKAAQLATTIRAVPSEYRRCLQVLQDRATPRPLAEVEQVLRSELGGSASELFAEFEPQARAAASLAQVHKARLPGGGFVAVKVQYAGLEGAVAADLTTITALSAAASHLFPDAYHLHWVLPELRGNLAQELDFRGEAGNAALLRQRLAGHPGVAIPAPVPQLSSRRVLTMEWLDGCRVDDAAALEAARMRPRDTGQLLLDVFATMMFESGCVHADPHPGNILVRPNPHQGWWWRWLGAGWRQPQIILLDHGLCLRLSDELRRLYCQLWCAFVTNDAALAEEVATAMAGPTGGRFLPMALKPGAMLNLPQEEAARIRKVLGVTNLGDAGRLLEQLPRPLVEMLRILGTVRTIATELGATLDDRVRINVTHALRGMALRLGPAGERQWVGGLASRRRRAKIAAVIYGLRALHWVGSVGASVLQAARRLVLWLAGVVSLGALGPN